ncbi:MAG: energy transducer TonB [Flavobacteriaceae bacterium]|nr:energy transducer TonB [Flavobacteriaceae bacterium]
MPDVVNDFEVKDNNVVTNSNNTSTQDNFTDTTNNNDTPTETNNTTITEVPLSRPFETVFSVEQLPMFPECKGLSRAEQKECFETQLSKRVIKNVVYPGDDLENGKQGTALVEFIIDEKGEIINVKALDNKRATLEMQLAAIKAIKKLPKLIPAKQGQKAVKVKYTLPVSFRLN